MANKVILGGRDVVKHYESHGDVKDKTMKQTNKQTIKGTEKGLQGLAENKPPPHFFPPTGSGGEKEGVLPWEKNQMHRVMLLVFPRNRILLGFKLLYVIFFESANSTISCVSSVEKVSSSYRLQILHIPIYLLAPYSSKSALLHVQTDFLFLKVANFTSESFVPPQFPFLCLCLIAWD